VFFLDEEIASRAPKRGKRRKAGGATARVRKGAEDAEDKNSGLPLLISMFNAKATTATLQEDWEGKWFSIVARLLPNKLTFRGVKLDGWEGEETGSVNVALALPRDGGLTPYVLSICTRAGP
jgi:hypothetical protein